MSLQLSAKYPALERISLNCATYLDSVWLPSPHVELVVAHAESQDSLVDPQPRREEHEVRRFLVNWLRKQRLVTIPWYIFQELDLQHAAHEC